MKGRSFVFAVLFFSFTASLYAPRIPIPKPTYRPPPSVSIPKPPPKFSIPESSLSGKYPGLSTRDSNLSGKYPRLSGRYPDLSPHDILTPLSPEVDSGELTLTELAAVNQYLKDNPEINAVFDIYPPGEKEQRAARFMRVTGKLPPTETPQERLSFALPSETTPSFPRFKVRPRYDSIFEPRYLNFSPDLAIPENYRGTILVKVPEELKAARAAITKAKAPRALVALQRSDNVTENLRTLSRRPDKVAIFHNFPETTAAASVIHSKPVNKKQVAEILRQRDRLILSASGREKVTLTDIEGAAKTHLVEGGKMNLAESLKTALSASDATTLNLVIGHVEGGGIRFADGTTLPIKAIPSDKRVWVLGCRTVWEKLDDLNLDLATGTAIRYADAVSATEVIVRDIEVGHSLHSIGVHLQNLSPEPKPAAAATLESPTTELPSAPELKPADPIVPSGFAFMLADANVAVIRPLEQAA
jgi:hypothetical protein